jgi:hypothetical protein
MRFIRVRFGGTDNFSKSRADDRRRKLDTRLDMRLIGLEERARAAGGSFIKDFLKTHFRPRKPSRWDHVK